MADTEFEEFRTHFDKLPQHIKAPSSIYRLVQDLDISPDGEKPPLLEDSKPSSAPGGRGYSSEESESTLEPFLKLPLPSEPTPTSSTNTGTLKRRRRRLPELPKHASNLKRNDDGNKRVISLAEEILAADALNHHSRPSETSPNNTTSPSPKHFVLRYSKGGGFDDESSSDSERYPSLDSGHSTLHSDDGRYSSQIPQPPINESLSPSASSLTSSFSSCGLISLSQLEVLEETHRGIHRFLPRHHDEIEIEIGDPIYMQKEADDLWCEGVNLKTGRQGIFPSAYVVDRNYNDFDPLANKVKKERYLTNYVGSIETLYHKGDEVLCAAVAKMTGDEKRTTPAASSSSSSSSATPCILEISDQGIRMVDKGKREVAAHDYFYALKNISFCGFHPDEERYFGFVSKHPTLNRFACHVFVSHQSSRPIAQAVGRAFQRFYQKFLETAYPIEDIYIE